MHTNSKSYYKIHIDSSTGITPDQMVEWYNDQALDGICLLQEVATGSSKKIHYQGLIEATFRTRKQLRNTFDHRFGKRGQGRTSVASFKSDEHMDNYLPYMCKGQSLHEWNEWLTIGTLSSCNFDICKYNQIYWTTDAIRKCKKNNQSKDDAYIEFMETYDDEPITHRECINRTIKYFGHFQRKGFLPHIIERYANLWMYKANPIYWSNVVADMIDLKYLKEY